MNKLLLVTALVAIFSLTIDDSFGATKKKKRSDYTAEQQKKIFAEGLKVCRKKYGPVGRVKVDYAKNRYLCYMQ